MRTVDRAGGEGQGEMLLICQGFIVFGAACVSAALASEGSEQGWEEGLWVTCYFSSAFAVDEACVRACGVG